LTLTGWAAAFLVCSATVAETVLEVDLLVELVLAVELRWMEELVDVVFKCTLLDALLVAKEDLMVAEEEEEVEETECEVEVEDILKCCCCLVQ
jgi:hypothetical protein